MKNRVKILFIGVVIAITTPLFGQGFWTADCTFFFGREMWFLGDTTDGHVEVWFDSSNVHIDDLAAWIDSVWSAATAVNADSFLNKYTELGHGLYWNGTVAYIDTIPNSGLVLGPSGLGVDTTMMATKEWVGNEGFLTSYTETDPVFSAWDKSTGISITESQISDLDHYDYWNVLLRLLECPD